MNTAVGYEAVETQVAAPLGKTLLISNIVQTELEGSYFTPQDAGYHSRSGPVLVSHSDTASVGPNQTVGAPKVIFVDAASGAVLLPHTLVGLLGVAAVDSLVASSIEDDLIPYLAPIRASVHDFDFAESLHQAALSSVRAVEGVSEVTLLKAQTDDTRILTRENAAAYDSVIVLEHWYGLAPEFRAFALHTTVSIFHKQLAEKTFVKKKNPYERTEARRNRNDPTGSWYGSAVHTTSLTVQSDVRTIPEKNEEDVKRLVQLAVTENPVDDKDYSVRMRQQSKRNKALAAARKPQWSKEQVMELNTPDWSNDAGSLITTEFGKATTDMASLLTSNLSLFSTQQQDYETPKLVALSPDRALVQLHQLKDGGYSISIRAGEPLLLGRMSTTSEAED